MILAVIEHSGGHVGNRISSNTNELLAFAQRIGRDSGVSVAAVVFGFQTSAIVDELKSRKLDRILVVDDPVLAEYSPDAYAFALRSMVSADSPIVVATMQSARGIDFMPRVAASLRNPFIAGCIEFERIGERLLLTRQIFNAKMNMKVEPRSGSPIFLTIAPGAFPGEAVDSGETASVETKAVDFSGLMKRRTVIAFSEA